MSCRFRLDFPPEVVAERNIALERIHLLLDENTLEAVRKAIGIQRDWLRLYPEDYVMWDAGEVLGMTEGALLVTTSHPSLVEQAALPTS